MILLNTQHIKNYCNFQYEGTFEDYLEMFIQFGYVTLFSSAYPLAGLWALLNNLFEIRGDAFKLCSVHQRPFGQRVSSVGTWQTAMEMMGVIACVVNCALIGQSGQVHRMFPNITANQTVILIVSLEVREIASFQLFTQACVVYGQPCRCEIALTVTNLSSREQKQGLQRQNLQQINH